MRIGQRIQALMFSFVIILSLFSFVFGYFKEYTLLMNELDSRINVAAHMVREMLGPDFFEGIEDRDSLSAEDFDKNVEVFNRLCVDMNMQYLWTLMKVGDDFVFTSSTSPDHIVRNQKHAKFFEVHTNPELYMRAANSMKITYQSNIDKWGNERIVLIPFNDNRGRTHIAGASVSNSYVKKLMTEAIRQYIFLFLIFVSFGILLSLLLSNILTSPFTRLIRYTNRIAKQDLQNRIPLFKEQGIEEERALIQAFNTLSTSINDHISDLNESRERMTMTLQAIGDGVIATDRNGYITRMNPVAEKMTGWTWAEAEDKVIDDIFTLETEPNGTIPEIPVYRAMATRRIEILSNSAILLSRSGERHRISDSAAPIITSQGELIGVILVFRDISEEYELQEQLNHAQRMDAIGQLAGGVAHDFNNMLGGIIGAVDLLKYDEVEDDEKTQLINIILDASSRAAELTSQLLAFSRKQNIPSTAFSIHEILAKVVSLLERSINKNIEIKTDFSSSKDYISGDPTQIQSTILNMGINASQAMPEGGTLSFSTEIKTLYDKSDYEGYTNLEAGEYIKISVKDTGHGIEEKNLNKIFEPFFTTKDVGKGTGLGLSAAYGTIAKHNGTIHVHSTVGKETIFHILLPLKENEKNLSEKGDSDTRPHGKGNILVVDDEAIMRFTCQKLLEQSGYTVTTAQNGQNALDVLRKSPGGYDLIILDMIMPEMDGKECFLKIREMNEDQKVIIASGYAHNEEFTDLKNRKMNGLLQKPYRRHELQSLVSEVLP